MMSGSHALQPHRIRCLSRGCDPDPRDSPADLPPDLDLVLVDWSARHADWADALRERSAPRVILFGRHTDLGAHSAAREAKLGPRWARSKLILGLATILHRTP